jgi:hypothetical protein
MGTRAHGHWWKLYSSSVSQAGTSHPLLGPQPATWHICKGCQVSGQGLDEQKTWGILAVHSGAKAGNGLLNRPTKRAGELLNLSRNQLRIMMGLLSGHYHLKGHVYKLCWQEAVGEVEGHMHVQWCHLFFVTVRHWWYQHLGTWANISWNPVMLLTSQSAWYCTLFRVWGCWTLAKAQKVGDDRVSRVAVVSALMYCTVLQDKEI